MPGAATTPTPPPAPSTRPPGSAATQPAPSADAAPATDADIAYAVNQQFPTHDANSDGTLDQGEFAAWMIPLQTAQLPDGTTPTDEQLQSWAREAFGTADSDGSEGLNQAEVTTYLGG